MKQTKRLLLFLLLAACILLSGGVCRAEEQFTFSYKGKKIEPTIISLDGSPDDIKKGDVARFEGFALVLDKPGEYDFTNIFAPNGSCTLIKKDGSKILVGIRIGKDEPDDNNPAAPNPLEKMTADEIKALRGIYIKTWPKWLEDKLKLIDPAKTLITIGERASQNGSNIFPPLPEKLKYLSIDECSNTGIKDYYPAAELKSLVFLDIDIFSMDEIDIAKFAGLKELRYLNTNCRKLANIQRLGNLTKLTSLRLSYNEDVADLTFAEKLKDLKSVKIAKTRVKDLSPLAKLKKLELIYADFSQVNKLPDKGFAALKKLRIMSTPLEKKDVDAFIKSHPGCKVYFDWNEALHSELQGITILRARTGGTCHRRIDSEKLLFEKKDAAIIENIISKINVVSDKSGNGCMCCGDYTLELYRGEKLVYTLVMHHGRTLDWDYGEWPGSGLLTEESANFLSVLLATRGERLPDDKTEKDKRRIIAIQREYERIKKIVPKNILDKIGEAENVKQIRQIFKAEIKDDVRRTEIMIKVFGANKSSWSIYSLNSYYAVGLLLNTDKNTLFKALKNVAGDPEGDEGASRLLFGEDKWKDFEDKDLSKLINLFGENALSNPRLINRRITLNVLGKIQNDTSIKLLITALKGQPSPRTLDKNDREESGSWYKDIEGYNALARECTDQAYAALVLAGAGHKESLEFIKELAKRSRGENQKALLEAVEILEGK